MSHSVLDRLAPHLVRTPVRRLAAWSERYGFEVYAKLETLQTTRSFKERGALNALLSLDEADRCTGVVCASAGNHAQGLALHGKRLGISVIAVMPVGTPTCKVDAVRSFGADVILNGEDYDAAAEWALGYARRTGMVFVHPYDNPHVIAGQGTIAVELIEQIPNVDALICPVGGGGLVCGVHDALKDFGHAAEVFGVETENFSPLSATLNGSTPGYGVDTWADGTAVRHARPSMVERVRRSDIDLLTVPEESVPEAIVELFSSDRLVIEGAAASALAALSLYPERFVGKTVAVILTGANIDPIRFVQALEQSNSVAAKGT